MKTTIKTINLILLTLVASFGLVLVGCDKVNPPYKKTQIVTPPDTGKNNNNKDSVYDAMRKILIEDYTGHTCGNCPKAAEKLEELIQIYGDKLVPLAVHVGFFAEPSVKPYKRDFRTPEGNALDAKFGNSVAGLPNGMINRKGFTNKSHIINSNGWNGTIAPYTTLAPDAVFAIKNDYNASSNLVQTSIYTKFKNNLTGTYKLCVYLVEDSVISAQTDYRLKPSTIEEYEFKHILKGSFNGVWGETITTNPTASETKVFTNKYSMNLAGKLFDIKNHCYVVAFIYNEASMEVVQASMKKIK